jgi:hypothetical protein
MRLGTGAASGVARTWTVPSGVFRIRSSALLPVLLRLKLQETETSAMVLESVPTIGMVQRVLRVELHAGVGVLPVHDRDPWKSPIW